MPQQSRSMQKSNSLGQTCMEWQTESFFFLGWQRYMDIPTKFLLPQYLFQPLIKFFQIAFSYGHTHIAYPYHIAFDTVYPINGNQI